MNTIRRHTVNDFVVMAWIAFMSLSACGNSSSSTPPSVDVQNIDTDSQNKEEPKATIPLVGDSLLQACEEMETEKWKEGLRASYGEHYSRLCAIVKGSPKERFMGSDCSKGFPNTDVCDNTAFAHQVGLLDTLLFEMEKKGGAIALLVQQKRLALSVAIASKCSLTPQLDLDICRLNAAKTYFQSLWAGFQDYALIQTTSCDRVDFHMAIDVGHSKKTAGARSATGRMEYEYNLNLALLTEAEFSKRGLKTTIINPSGGPYTLSQRKQAAHSMNASVLMSIHHDSVQEKFLSEWSVNGKTERYCDDYDGYSFFYSNASNNPTASVALAQSIGLQLNSLDYSPSDYHAAKIPGENRELIRADIGLYRRDSLGVLRGSKMTSLLFEAGVIVNRAEEKNLSDPMKQSMMAAAIAEGVTQFCRAGHSK